MKHYISNGDWFDEGTEAFPTWEIQPEDDSCVFRGLVNGKEDEELCPLDEFTIQED